MLMHRPNLARRALWCCEGAPTTKPRAAAQSRKTKPQKGEGAANRQWGPVEFALAGRTAANPPKGCAFLPLTVSPRLMRQPSFRAIHPAVHATFTSHKPSRAPCCLTALSAVPAIAAGLASLVDRTALLTHRPPLLPTHTAATALPSL